MTDKVLLVEIDLVSPAGAMTTLHLSDRAISPLPPTDADRPNVAWDDRLIEAPTIQRMLFADMMTLEPGLGVGLMTLANADRALDLYQSYVWGEVRMWRWTSGQPFASAAPLMTGPVAGTPTYDIQTRGPSRVRVTLFDYRLELERPVQSVAFSGANDVDAGIYFEGEPALAGRLRPLAFGDLTGAHIPAPLVNTYINAYRLHDGPVAPSGIGGYAIEIYDRGGPAGLEGGDDLSAEVDIDAEFYYAAMYPDVIDNPFDPRPPGEEETVPEDPPPGESLPPRWQAWTAGGLIKLNASLVGEIALGFRGDATGGYVQTAGPIVARVLARSGVPAERIGASVAAFPAPAVVGAYSATPATARELVGWIGRSVLMAILPDRSGVWQAFALGAAEAEAVIEIIEDDILHLEADESAPRGAGEFNVGWGRIWTTYRRQNLQVELQFTEAEARLGEAYRHVLIEDAGFKARYPSSWRPLTLDTALRHEADALALAIELKALFGLAADGTPRRQWRLTLEMSDAVEGVQLGATIQITAPQWGVDGRFILIGEEPLRPRRDQIIWTVWG